ncbi:6204_t:CDS:2, partial [Funneliformis mosseae]
MTCQLSHEQYAVAGVDGEHLQYAWIALKREYSKPVQYGSN